MRFKTLKHLKDIFYLLISIYSVTPEIGEKVFGPIKPTLSGVCAQVSGVDLQAASHEEAVNAIKSAPSPVVFIVQSLSATPRVLTHSVKPHSDRVNITGGGGNETLTHRPGQHFKHPVR